MSDDFDELRDDVQNVLANTEYITVFLYGSRAIGFSHNLSDIDVMVLSNSRELHIKSSDKLEVQVVSIADIQTACGNMSESRLLNYNSQILLANLYHGRALLNSKKFDAVRRNIPWNVIINNMINDRLRGYKFYKKDAYRFYDTFDYNSSRFCFQKSLESLLDAYMFSKKQLIVKEKWRIKWFQKHSSELCDELISIYMAIWSDKNLLSVISRWECYCTKIFQLITGGQT